MLPPIETLHKPSLAEFQETCRRRQGPFKMTGVVDH